MGRFLGSSININSGGAGGGGSSKTLEFTRTSGITTDSYNHVIGLTVGSGTNEVIYSNVGYNTLTGLITSFTEKIGGTEKSFTMQYDSTTNLVTNITEV
tara:strand:+ start:339 stop:635 length:297 start_codon:yes stop_codon:yes gene_type:complete